MRVSRISAFAGLAGPSLTFQVWRGSTQIDPATVPLLIGDTFQVLISGAAPNGAITVYRSDGATATLPGTTDANGDYTYSGAINASYPVGTFLETWDVNGQPVGQYTFSTTTAAAVAQAAAATAAQQTAAAAAAQQASAATAAQQAAAAAAAQQAAAAAAQQNSSGGSQQQSNTTPACSGFTVGSTCISTAYAIAGGVGLLVLVMLMGGRR